MKQRNRQRDRFSPRGHVIKVDLLPVKWQSARHLDTARLVPREETPRARMHIFIFIWNFKKVAWKLLLYVMLSPRETSKTPSPLAAHNPPVPPSLTSFFFFFFFLLNGRRFSAPVPLWFSSPELAVCVTAESVGSSHICANFISIMSPSYSSRRRAEEPASL